MPSESWRPVTDYEGWQQNLEKRLMHEERRPLVTSAADLLGPGAGPFAIETFDWNAEECTFVGVFYSLPDQSQNSPDGTKGWIGETFGVEDGTGFQRVTIYDPVGPSPGFEEHERRFVTASGTRLFSAWERTDIGAIVIPPQPKAGTVVTASYTTAAAWQAVATVTFSAPFPNNNYSIALQDTTNFSSAEDGLWLSGGAFTNSGFEIEMLSPRARASQTVDWTATFHTQ